MGKKFGYIALFLGVFLLVLAALAKFYAYDRLAVVPLDQKTTTYSATAEGDDATYLDVAAEGGPAIEQGPLRSTRNTIGQVKETKTVAKRLDKDVAVWDTYSYTAPPDFDPDSGAPLSGTRDILAFDRTSGKAVAWDGATSESSGTKKDTKFEGQYFKFPFNTQKKTYQFWDGSLGEATPAKYVKSEELKGLSVLRFEQKIEPTKIAELDAPGTLVGEPGTPSVKTDRMYSTTRTLWVEPETGVIIKGEDDQLSTLAVDGETKATITQAKLAYDDKTITATVDEYKPLATALTAIRVWVPIGGLIAGLVLVAVGAFALARGTRRSGARPTRAKRGERVAV